MSTIISGDAANVSNSLTRTVIDATNATPIVIQTSVPHLYASGDNVYVSGVGGNTAANGIFTITVVDADHFELDGSVGNGAYTAGGVVVDFSLTPQFTIPSDGDVFNAAAFNVAFQALADRTQFLATNIRMKSKTVTASGPIALPANCMPIVYLKARGSGGGGGGGGRGNATNTDYQFSTGGAGGGAGELIEGWYIIVPGDDLDVVIGAAGTAGVGSATVDGTSGGDGGDVTVTDQTPTLLLTARGGRGGGGSVRNIGAFGASVGGRSKDFEYNATAERILDIADSAMAEQLFIEVLRGKGHPGSGSTGLASATYLTNYLRLKWATELGTTATDGADGANDAAKIGGQGGGGGGCTETAVGGTGGAGGDAVAAGAGVAGSVGSAPAADALSCGGGGGGSGGTGATGGAGADGAVGIEGYATCYYFGEQI